MATPYGSSYIKRSVKICFSFLVSAALSSLYPSQALAIPSPELVLSSVSSLSQVFAVGAAMASGGFAFFASRLGLRFQRHKKRYPVGLIIGLVGLSALLAAANQWQWQSHRMAEQNRLQETLVRPAQFDGTEIKDEALKETSYLAQTKHDQSITTAQAEDLLNAGNIPFFDIRETAEHEMGSLPGATHIRYPDFTKAPPVAPGEQVVLFCHNGNRSSETCAMLAKLGIDCRFIAGGIEKWIVEGRRFSDATVQSLGDLRSIPDYPNKSRLLSTQDFKSLLQSPDVQIVDTRYPRDFEGGHLPDAINIPLRALTSEELAQRIAALRPVPTVAACYDRRSCFMAQVLGLEMTRAGVPFAGRYTVPWEYFVPPPPKPHVVAWVAEQQMTPWQRAINLVADALIWGHERSHFLFSLLILAVLSRLFVLPVALKSEQDQLLLARHKDTLVGLKKRLADDPTRRARAIRHFYVQHGLTPIRNMAALLFLPATMLGVSAVEQAAGQIHVPFLWISDLGAADATWIAPSLVCAIAALYLIWAIAKTKWQRVLWLGLGVPGVFYLTASLSAATNLYLLMSLLLLLVQRGYVVGWRGASLRHIWQRLRLPKGVYTLDQSAHLHGCGNKALRLALMREVQLPVPRGLVLPAGFLRDFERSSPKVQHKIAKRLWRVIGHSPCAVRSSASHEDGAEQSFAGVFDSVLNVTGDQLHHAIETVAASFLATHTQSYAGTTEGTENILIQQMVAAEYAGVLFTQDPTSVGAMLLEWVKGTGETLVSGSQTPVTERFGRLTLRPLTQDVDMPFDPRPLLEMGRQIEALFGRPQDIEWAFAEGRYYILQSRDITTADLGSEQDKARGIEWRQVFDHFDTGERGAQDPDERRLEQDEMSEVLPRATPLSFSLMCAVWAPGGSLDLACRALSLPYRLPEGDSAHLVRLFGKTYVDVRLKSQLALDLTAGRSKRLDKALKPTQERFISVVLPDLHDRLCMWQAIRYEALPSVKILEAIDRLRHYFLTEIYMEAEQINVLANFAMDKAVRAASGDPTIKSYLMQADVEHSPARILASCTGSKAAAQARALDVMGHRSMFDYELASPRYSEAPSLLFSLLYSEPNARRPQAEVANLPEELRATLQTAVAYQDLKERAKHEALKVVAELRRALLALGAQSGLGELLFYLTFDELLNHDWSQPEGLRDVAQMRADHDRLCRDLAPRQTRLTISDCERLCLGQPPERRKGAIAGTCVAGSGRIVGRVFRVEENTQEEERALAGFSAGDILVCRMINPAWLAQVQQAGAVVSEVGGWLSHMAIVAREKQILMVVGCDGVDQLQTGQRVEVDDSGSVIPHEQGGSRSIRA